MIDGLCSPYGDVIEYTVEVTTSSLAPFCPDLTMKGTENGTSPPDVPLTNGVSPNY